MNTDLNEVIRLLAIIQNLCLAPHWTSERIGQIFEYAEKAQEHALHLNQRFLDVTSLDSKTPPK